MDKKVFENFRLASPLVHSITNYVTVNDVANSLLAIGASPIMADDIEEMEDIGKISDALVLNIGTLNSRLVDSMLEAGRVANELGKFVVLDPVGVGASKLRMKTVKKLIEKIDFDLIRGNASEIKALAGEILESKGVDVSEGDMINESNLEYYVDMAKELSLKYKSLIIITGQIDILTNGEKTYLVRNGHPDMEKVSGTGCMLSGLLGAALAANPEDSFKGALYGLALMGISGELAVEDIEKSNLGTGSLKTKTIDQLSLLDWGRFKEVAKIESI